MIFVYNFLQIILLLPAMPILVLYILCRRKYRTRILERLGFGLSKRLRELPLKKRKVIWVHALSVGEVTSAVPLVKRIKEEIKDVCIVFTASTSTGYAIAGKELSSFADAVLPSPVDILLTVNRFIAHIRPDLFILTETDFWPNWLDRLRRKQIPLMLVNGRISRKSYTTYRRFHFFFSPLFQTFSLVSVQTEDDARQLIRLGVSRNRILPLGNLKYGLDATESQKAPLTKEQLGVPDDAVILICGSTHKGEEDILFEAFEQLKGKHDKLVMIVAPRNPERSGEIVSLAQATGYPVTTRTAHGGTSPSILILDTLGELAHCYVMAKAAFIGGSLVPCGGHNPLEAAVKGVPVLFGPHMEDFKEIADDCIRHEAGIKVHSATEISQTLDLLLRDNLLHARMSEAAQQMVIEKSQVISAHIQAVRNLLSAADSGTIN